MIYGPVRAPVFWQDACRTLGQNCCKLLELTEEEITPTAIMGLVASLPESKAEVGTSEFLESKLSQSLKGLWSRSSNHDVIEELTDYFLNYIPAQGMSAVVLMKDSFTGVISGLES